MTRGGVNEIVDEKESSRSMERLSAVEEGEKKGSWERKRRFTKLGVRRKKLVCEALGGVMWTKVSEKSRWVKDGVGNGIKIRGGIRRGGEIRERTRQGEGKKRRKKRKKT